VVEGTAENAAAATGEVTVVATMAVFHPMILTESSHCGPSVGAVLADMRRSRTVLRLTFSLCSNKHSLLWSPSGRER